MPNIKEKLVELIGSSKYHPTATVSKNIANHLIANGVTIQKWISVEERLPEPLVGVLVHHEDGEIYVGVWFKSFSHFLGEDDDNRVTHWMPLPEPPKEDV